MVIPPDTPRPGIGPSVRRSGDQGGTLCGREVAKIDDAAEKADADEKRGRSTIEFPCLDLENDLEIATGCETSDAHDVRHHFVDGNKMVELRPGSRATTSYARQQRNLLNSGSGTVVHFVQPALAIAPAYYTGASNTQLVSDSLQTIATANDLRAAFLSQPKKEHAPGS